MSDEIIDKSDEIIDNIQLIYDPGRSFRVFAMHYQNSLQYDQYDQYIVPKYIIPPHFKRRFTDNFYWDPGPPLDLDLLEPPKVETPKPQKPEKNPEDERGPTACNHGFHRPCEECEPALLDRWVATLGGPR